MHMYLSYVVMFIAQEVNFIPNPSPVKISDFSQAIAALVPKGSQEAIEWISPRSGLGWDLATF